MKFQRVKLFGVFFVIFFSLTFSLLPNIGNTQPPPETPCGLAPLQPCGLAAKCGHAGFAPCQLCNLAELVQNIINFLIVDVATPVAALSFAVAGIIYMTAGGNPGKISRAHNIFRKVAIGFIIMLAAWLLITTLMNGLLGDSNFGKWYEFQCVTQPTPPPLPAAVAPAPAPLPTPSPTPTPSGGGGGPLALCDPGNPACSTGALVAAGFSCASASNCQANAMSCIAMTESSGKSNGPDSGTGDCGTFQISPPNWGDATLHRLPCSTAKSYCYDAACNMQTAFLLSQRGLRAGQSAYADWTCCTGITRSQECVNRYDP